MKKVLRQSFKVLLAVLMVITTFSFAPSSSSTIEPFTPITAEASGTTYRVIGNPLNVRRGPGTNHPVVTTRNLGVSVTVHETRGNWSRIGNNRWVSRNFITRQRSASGARIVTGINPGSFLNVRSAPIGTSRSVRRLNNGARINVTHRTDNGWYRIRSGEWVNRNFLRADNNSIGTIRYNGGGHTSGTVPSSHTLNVPGSAQLRQPGNLARSGYRFGGWRSSSSGNTFRAGATVTFNNPGTTTYTAVWIRNNNSIGTIRYDGGGHTSGTVPSSHTLNVPGSAQLRQPGNMVRRGYRFRGWRSSSSGNTFQAGATVTFTNPGTTTYTAVWTRVDDSFGDVRE